MALGEGWLLNIQGGHNTHIHEHQIYLFYSSKYVIGAHGAGFANLAFCKSNTKVYEILNANQSYRPAIKTVCKHLNLKHKKIIITKRNNQNSEYNMTVDIDAFKKIIKSWLKSKIKLL